MFDVLSAAEDEPSPHDVQSAEPVVSLYVPAANDEQMSPSGSVYPVLQNVIQASLDVLATGEDVPREQFLLVEIPEIAAYVSTTHGVHVVCSVTSWYVPTAHLVHTDRPVVSEYVPAAHDAHTVRPVAPPYVPTGHLLHTDAHTVAHVVT